jgi:hypothetical protein
MPKNQTTENTNLNSEPEFITTLEVVAKPEVIEETMEPYLSKLAPNSPWKILHSDGSIITYIFEIARVGVLIRTESPANQSESMVFIPNIESSDLPDCE